MPAELVKLPDGSCEKRALPAICPCRQSRETADTTDRHGQHPYKQPDQQFHGHDSAGPYLKWRTPGGPRSQAPQNRHAAPPYQAADGSGSPNRVSKSRSPRRQQPGSRLATKEWGRRGWCAGLRPVGAALATETAQSRQVTVRRPARDRMTSSRRPSLSRAFVRCRRT